MDTFDVGRSLKLQGYLNNQNLEPDDVQFLDTMKFKQLYTEEEFQDIYRKVEKYRVLEQNQLSTPTAENSEEMQELAQDVLYSTGQAVHSIRMSDLKRDVDIERLMTECNTRSKNDLFVQIDYDDYSNNSNFVKCKVVGHDTEWAYGIQANAKMIVTKSGKVITTKNALYSK